MKGRAALLPMLALLAETAVAAWQFAAVEGPDGVPLSMVTAGDPRRPAVLLIHGIGQSHYSFVRQLDSDLAEDFYLVAFDLRGHGASGKPWAASAYAEPGAWAGDVAAVLAASGATRPVVVAWSYGTLVLMDYLRVHGPDALAGIVLTGALGGVTPMRVPPPDDPGMARFAETRRLQASADFGDQKEAAERMVDLLAARPIPEPYRRIFINAGFMLPQYARRAMVSRGFDNQDLVDQLNRLPVLLAVGSEDNPFLAEDGAALAARFATVTLSRYEGAGHSVFFEAPERFNAELRAFVRSLPRAGPAGASSAPETAP